MWFRHSDSVNSSMSLRHVDHRDSTVRSAADPRRYLNLENAVSIDLRSGLGQSSGDIIRNAPQAWDKRRAGRRLKCVRSVRRPEPGEAGSARCPLRNLAPADLKKDANGSDLPIALGLLLASGQVAFDRPGNYAIVVELALTGEPRSIKGIRAMALEET